MSHSFVSIDALIRKGNSLKNRIGMIARDLEPDTADCLENLPHQSEKEPKSPGLLPGPICFLTPLPNGLEQTISDIFSVICSFKGIDHGGIYILNAHRKQLDLVCHYNLPDNLITRVIRFNRDSWQFNTVLRGIPDFNEMQQIPLHARIAYEQNGIQAVALIPLIHQGQVVGCMNLASPKDGFINGFETLVIEGLAIRISRIIALHLAQVRLSKVNEGLTSLMANLRDRFRSVTQPSGTEPEPINGLFAGMKDEIDGLCRAISLASEKIIQKLRDGQQRRELPFLKKKVDTMLNDIDFIVKIFNRLQFFYRSQSATLECGILEHDNASNETFLNSLTDFYEALEVLVRQEKLQEPVNSAFLNGHFEPLEKPVRLGALKIKIDRLTSN